MQKVVGHVPIVEASAHQTTSSALIVRRPVKDAQGALAFATHIMTDVHTVALV